MNDQHRISDKDLKKVFGDGADEKAFVLPPPDKSNVKDYNIWFEVERAVG